MCIMDEDLFVEVFLNAYSLADGSSTKCRRIVVSFATPSNSTYSAQSCDIFVYFRRLEHRLETYRGSHHLREQYP